MSLPFPFSCQSYIDNSWTQEHFSIVKKGFVDINTGLVYSGIRTWKHPSSLNVHANQRIKINLTNPFPQLIFLLHKSKDDYTFQHDAKLYSSHSLTRNIDKTH